MLVPRDEESEQEADRRRRTRHPFDLKDKDTTAIGFIRRDPEPVPDPDRNTVIYEVTRVGEILLHRVVPRARWPHGQGCIEYF